MEPAYKHEFFKLTQAKKASYKEKERNLRHGYYDTKKHFPQPQSYYHLELLLTAQSCAFVQRGVAAWQSGSTMDHPMVMIRQADQAVIGVTGYTSQNGYNDAHQGHYEIGYWCGTTYQGKGYVTESVNALTRYAFEGLGATKVTIVMQVDNQKSQAVAKRLGFAYQGQKDRSPTECPPGRLPKSHVYSVENAEHLPALSYS